MIPLSGPTGKWLEIVGRVEVTQRGGSRRPNRQSSQQRHNMEIRSSGLEPTNLDWVPILDTSIDPLAFPVGPQQLRAWDLFAQRTTLRRIIRPWTEEDIAKLKRLQASGASAARASVALKRSRQYVKEKARALGVPFMTMRERRKRQAGREAAERVAAGLPPEQRG
jgi:hypothetical protein